jgi:hypothetical protein
MNYDITPSTACRAPLFLEKPWIWLIFSLYYFVPVYYMKVTTETLIFLCGGYVLFVLIYLWGTKLNQKHVWKAIVTLTAAAVRGADLARLQQLLSLYWFFDWF